MQFVYIQFQYIHWFWDTNLKCVYTQFWQSCARQINYHHQSSACGSLSTVTLHNAPLHCTGLGFPPLLASFRGLVSVSPHSERGVISWPGRTMQTSVTSVISPAQTNQYCPAQWSTVITRASNEGYPKVSIVSYSRPSLMIIALCPNFTSTYRGVNVRLA